MLEAKGYSMFHGGRFVSAICIEVENKLTLGKDISKNRRIDGNSVGPFACQKDKLRVQSLSPW